MSNPPASTALPPLEPAERRRFITATVVAGILCIVAVFASGLFGTLRMIRISAECVDPLVCYGPDATMALLGPTLAQIIGPAVLFLIGGIMALVRRGRRQPGVANVMVITVIAQLAWIVGSGILLVVL